ncbi:mechanosensitive ion channel [bacterium]|nr:mechanosensitive ion channel [bacterium]
MTTPVLLPEHTSVLMILLGTAAVAAVLFSFRRIKQITWLKKRARDRMNRLQPLLEAGGIMVILFWIVWGLFRGEPAYTIAVIALAAAGFFWAMRFFLNDVVAGIVLRSENLFTPGDGIMVEDQRAVIDIVGVRCLTVNMADGKTIRMPYSRLIHMPLIKPTAHTIAKSHTFDMTVPKKERSLDIFDRIRRAALNTAWSMATLTPGVELISESEAEYQFRVTVYALRSEYFSEIEKSVRNTSP